MNKYYVAAEADRYCGSGMFGSILGFRLIYFTVQLDGPVNADILYEAINKDRKSGIDYKKLNNMLEDALAKETKESLEEFLDGQK